MRLSSSSAQTAASAKIEIKPPSLNGVVGHGGTDSTYGTNGDIPGGTPASGLSDYVFTLESSGNPDPLLYTDKSNIWVTNHTNVASGSTPTFSWTPDVADIDDFYNANEMLIHGNDIYIIYRWGNYNKNTLGNSYWDTYQKNAINPDTGLPFGEWPLRDGNSGANISQFYDSDGVAYQYGDGYQTSCNILVKFTNCVVDEVAQTITYDSFEKRILFGVSHLHGNARTNNKWILSERTDTYGKPASSYGVDQTIVVVDLNKPISDAKIYTYGNLFKGAYGTKVLGTTTTAYDHVLLKSVLFGNTSLEHKEKMFNFDEHGNICPIFDSSDQITATGSYAYIMGYDMNEPAWSYQITPSGYFKFDNFALYRDVLAGEPNRNAIYDSQYIDFYGEKYKGWTRALLRVNLDNGQVETVCHTFHSKGGGNIHPFSYDKYIFTITFENIGIVISRYDLEAGELTTKILLGIESGHIGYVFSTITYPSVDIVSELNNVSVNNVNVSVVNEYATLSSLFGSLANASRYATDDFPAGNYARTTSYSPHSAHTDGEFIYIHISGNPNVFKLNYSDLTFHSFENTGSGGAPTDDYVKIGDYIFVGNETSTPYSINYYHKDNVTTDNGQIATMTHAPWGVFHSDFKF